MPPFLKRVLFSVLIVLFFSFPRPSYGNGVKNVTDMAELEEMVPLIEPGKELMRLMVNDSRRKLGSFQICSLCTCCGPRGGYCVPTPCCYAISCNIPNRPFGFCSFVPKACHCFGCHV